MNIFAKNKDALILFARSSATSSGNFAPPSSMVRKTTFCAVGILVSTGTMPSSIGGRLKSGAIAGFVGSALAVGLADGTGGAAVAGAASGADAAGVSSLSARATQIPPEANATTSSKATSAHSHFSFRVRNER